MIRDILTIVGLTVLIWAVYDVTRKTLLQRRARSGIDAAAYGLVPREELDARRAGPPREHDDEVSRVVEAAWQGAWEPAAAYLTDAGEDWELRWDRLQLLAEVAAEDEQWLRAWRANRPDDASAVAVHAAALLGRAWDARGTAYANKTSDQQMALFTELLPTAMHAAQEAARMAPRDPSPWVTMVTAARGLNLPHKQFRELWDELVARAPHHYDAHWQALQYWCEKWHGSQPDMFAFAERAMESALPGSLLPAMYLHALDEAARQRGNAVYQGRKVRTKVTEVRQRLAQVSADDRGLPGVRHLLAAALVKGGRHTEALEQFRLIGRWCGADPWARSADPAREFDHWRTVAALGAGRPGR
ncbi:hypothetical protein [Streptomyces sp. NPDC001970]